MRNSNVEIMFIVIACFLMYLQPKHSVFEFASSQRPKPANLLCTTTKPNRRNFKVFEDFFAPKITFHLMATFFNQTSCQLAIFSMLYLNVLRKIGNENSIQLSVKFSQIICQYLGFPQGDCLHMETTLKEF